MDVGLPEAERRRVLIENQSGLVENSDSLIAAAVVLELHRGQYITGLKVRHTRFNQCEWDFKEFLRKDATGGECVQIVPRRCGQLGCVRADDNVATDVACFRRPAAVFPEDAQICISQTLK